MTTYVVYQNGEKASGILNWWGVMNFIPNTSFPDVPGQMPFFVPFDWWIYEVVYTNDPGNVGLIDDKYYEYRPDMVPPTEEQYLEWSKQSGFMMIDGAAGEARAKYLTVVTGQDLTYIEKEKEARAYQVDPTGSYPFLEAEALECDMTVSDVASLVIQTADAWRAKGAVIEGIRRGGKMQVSLATTTAQVDQIATSYVTRLQEQ